MPDGEYNYLEYLQNYEPLQPSSLFMEHTNIVDTVITSLGAPDQRLQKRQQNVKGSEDPLHDSVNSF